MASAPAHYKEVEDLVAAEVLMPVVEKRQLQRVDDAAHRIDDTAGKEPAERRGGHVVEDLRKCQYTGPAHSDIEDGRDPLRAVYPECLDEDACDGDAPYDGEEDDARSPLQHDKAYRRVASRDEHGDHHVIDFLKDRIYFS